MRPRGAPPPAAADRAARRARPEDAATTRRETRAWDAWGHKLLWMTAYFTLGVWSSIALVSAPRKRSDKRIPLLARELSVSIC